MKNIIFIDTEFTDFIDMSLISIGLTSLLSNISDFYQERNDWYLDSKPSEFVYANVLPLLTIPASQRVSKAELAIQLVKWLSQVDESIIAIDYQGDWDLFCDLLYDSKWPTNIQRKPLHLGNLLQNSEFQQGMLNYFKKTNVADISNIPLPHHALHDAISNKMGWLAVSDMDKQDYLALLK